MPYGNLENAHRRDHFSDDECLEIFHQSLSALAYLHGRPKPIAHRDIKPQNILVEYRDPNRNPNHLRIKLSDFGLSKTGSTFNTFCGTDTYIPPEVRNNKLRQKYTNAVDIWSLGVVMLRFAYALPHPGHGIGMRWCKKIVEEASDWHSEGLIDILRRMLVIEPKARPSAADCLREASRLLASSRGRSATPTPASYAAGHGATTAHLSPEGGGAEEQETLRVSPHKVCSGKRSPSWAKLALIAWFYSNTFLRKAVGFPVGLWLPTGPALLWTKMQTPCPKVEDTLDPTPLLRLRRGQHPSPERGYRRHPGHPSHPVEDTPSDACPPAVRLWNPNPGRSEPADGKSKSSLTLCSRTGCSSPT